VLPSVILSLREKKDLYCFDRLKTSAFCLSFLTELFSYLYRTIKKRKRRTRRKTRKMRMMTEIDV